MMMSIRTFFQAVAVIVVITMLLIAGVALINQSIEDIHRRKVQECMNYDRFTQEDCEFIVSVLK